MLRLAKMIGRRDFDGAINYLRAGLKGDEADLASLEMIAHCQHWAGRHDEAIAACRETLKLDPVSFEMHAMLAQIFAEKGEHDEAAEHARTGLESYPEPLPKVSRIVVLAFKALGRIAPRLQGAAPDAALRRVEAMRAEWFDWAKQYLSWYDATYNGSVNPTKH